LVGPENVDPDKEPANPPPARGWLRPGSGFLGLPWILGLAAITVIPLAIYVISYIPWIALGNQWFTGYPAGHTGQTFIALQQSMYEYHNYLRATHPASSPWWAWPLRPEAGLVRAERLCRRDDGRHLLTRVTSCCSGSRSRPCCGRPGWRGADAAWH
jgi:hypothetical protein